ncbi:regulating synaptic membrane exocytosis protein 2 [Aplysia californica]|uniref:Regulating synaptic membrane exocytosis protein 2 n=1 Tax=Aplysia californica TaxID=6500 RepID=A0ABM1ABP3_APLCA|nr:regulating synaptic membrane exocytosis protein 2 [Aplysia californica]
MTFLLKKVIKPWGSSKDSRLSVPEKPVCPPSPDLSHLTPDEISVINDVIRRQEEFDRQEAYRIKKLKDELDGLQQQLVQRSESALQDRKQVDLRLCRLCFKTKFADGVGRVCHDCQQRVCSNCGAFSKPRWNAKKNKNVRGRWRCKLCSVRREVLCRTGGWYHATPDSSEGIRNKLSLALDPEAETDAGSSTCQGNGTNMEDSEHYPSGNRTDSELLRRIPTHATNGGMRRVPPGTKRFNRRRSIPPDSAGGKDEKLGKDKKSDERLFLVDDDDDNDSLDSMILERRMSRKRRQEKKQRRKWRAGQDASLESLPVSDRPPSCSSGSGEMVQSPQSDVSCPVKGRSGQRRDSVTRPLWGHSSSLNTSIADRRPSPIQEAKGGYSDTDSETSSVFSSFRDSSFSDNGTCSPYPGPLLLRIIRQDAVSLNSSCFSLASANTDSRCGGLGARSQMGSSDPLSARSRDSLRATSPVVHERKVISSKSKESPKGGSEKSLTRWKNEGFDNCFVFTLHHTPGKEPPYGIKLTGGIVDSGHVGRTVITWVSPDLKSMLGPGHEILEWNGERLRGQTFDQVVTTVSNVQPHVQIVLDRPECRPDEGKTAPEEVMKPSQSLDRTATWSPTIDQAGKGGKRRMLPKTPVEIKRRTRRVHGELQLRLHYQAQRASLAVTVLRARHLCPTYHIDPAPPSPFVVISLVPFKRGRDSMETEIKASNTQPEWEQTFLMTGITLTELATKSVQVTVWNYETSADAFMGEVLLDLAQAPLDNEAAWYKLEEHDENSARLPPRRRSHSASMSASLTSGSFRDSLLTSPTASPEVPSLRQHRQSPCSIRSASISPVPFGSASRVGSREFHLNSAFQPDSFTTKVRRKMRSTVNKMSSLSLIEKKDNAGSDESYHSDAHRGPNDRSDRSGAHSRSPSLMKRGQNSSHQSMDLLAPPQAPSRTNSSSSFFISDDEESQGRFSTSPVAPDRPAPDGDDITSTLGPGQIPPKPSAETSVCGNIKLGFMVSKGQLEVDIICAVGLHRSGQTYPPDTYVKTYLVEGKKVIQRKKTLIVKSSCDPLYRKKVKYSACNVHGRIMKVNIWEKAGSFEKKLCRGEVLVKLDCLDLSKHTMAWYKLFEINSTDYGSDEFLNSW